MCDPTTMLITGWMLQDRVTRVTRVTAGRRSRRSIAAGPGRPQHPGRGAYHRPALLAITCSDYTECRAVMDVADQDGRGN